MTSRSFFNRHKKVGVTHHHKKMKIQQGNKENLGKFNLTSYKYIAWNKSNIAICCCLFSHLSFNKDATPICL